MEEDRQCPDLETKHNTKAEDKMPKISKIKQQKHTKEENKK